MHSRETFSEACAYQIAASLPLLIWRHEIIAIFRHYWRGSETHELGECRSMRTSCVQSNLHGQCSFMNTERPSGVWIEVSMAGSGNAFLNITEMKEKLYSSCLLDCRTPSKISFPCFTSTDHYHAAFHSAQIHNLSTCYQYQKPLVEFLA